MTAHCYIDSLRHEGVNLRVRGVAGAANQKRESSSKLEGKKIMKVIKRHNKTI